jgi:hypothetical protein
MEIPKEAWDGKWHEVVTWTGGRWTKDYVQRIYVDGVLVAGKKETKT